jgi:hypothetical protein
MCVAMCHTLNAVRSEDNHRKGAASFLFLKNGKFYRGRDYITVTQHPSESHPISRTEEEEREKGPKIERDWGRREREKDSPLVLKTLLFFFLSRSIEGGGGGLHLDNLIHATQ